MHKKKMIQMHELRKYERFNLEIPTRIEPINGDSSKEISHLTTSNICAGGAFFNTDKPLPESTKVKLEITLPLDKLKNVNGTSRVCVLITGRVLRCENGGMAIVFNEDYQLFPQH
jgi:hypothetical protein